MKKWIVLALALLLIPALVWGWGTVIISGNVTESSGEPTPFWTETFEGSNNGFDNTPDSYTTNPDYTSYTCDGTDSMEVSNSETVTWTITNSDEIYVSFCLTVSEVGAFSNMKHRVMRFLDGSSNVIATCCLHKPSPSILNIIVVADGGTGSSGISINSGVSYKLLIHCKKGTGSDTLIECWITMDGEFSGSPDISSEDGTNSNQITKLAVANAGNYNDTFVEDKIRVYSSKPTNF